MLVGVVDSHARELRYEYIAGMFALPIVAGPYESAVALSERARIVCSGSACVGHEKDKRIGLAGFGLGCIEIVAQGVAGDTVDKNILLEFRHRFSYHRL